MRELEKGISVIICTYNGADKLPATLDHLRLQSVPASIPWEVIVVDNCSTDGSTAVANRYQKEFGMAVPLRVLSEPQPGKYYALTRGINAARYSYFIVCDDDNWLAKDYIDRAFNILDRNSAIGAAGGQSFPVFENEHTKIPDWIHKDRERYAIGVQGTASGDVTSRKFLWGAGMVSRVELYRSFFDKYPSLFVRYGRDEGHFVAEDTEYCLRLILRGYALYYDQDLTLQHFAPNERLTEAYHFQLNQRIDDSFDLIDKYLQATKLFGRLAYSKLNMLRLKLLTPLRVITAMDRKKKRKHKILLQLMYGRGRGPDQAVDEIRNFAMDDSLPSISR